MVDIVFSYSEFVMKLFYSEKSKEFWINRVIVGSLELIPAFNFTQAFSLVAAYASKNMNWNEMRWTDGLPFSTEMYYKKNEYHNDSLGWFRLPSVHHIVLRTVNMTFVFFVLWWYLDHVIANNRGVALPFNFMF